MRLPVLVLIAGAVVGAYLARPAEMMAQTGVAPESVRQAWLPDQAEVVYWHWQKDRYGPALTGNESWHHFLRFVEDGLAEAGVVDLRRNEWTFDRWRTSHWPDDSHWSLEVGKRRVPVVSFGANSGSTGPAGVTAPLVPLRPGGPLEDLEGRIAVARTQVDAATVAALAGADYEFHSLPSSYPEAGGMLPESVDSVSWNIFPQLMQTTELIAAARRGNAAGLLLIFDAGREQMQGLYTFPVPDHYSVPTLMLDREEGARVLQAAHAGLSATLRLEAEVVQSEAYQLVGYLPGRHYGTDADEVIQLVTHTDGPSISQDNGALGLLGLVRYFSRIPQAERSRTLMVFLDCRHFMPGQEARFEDEDFFARNPTARDRVVAMIGMEHLGQIEYVEDGHRLRPSGRADTSMIWTTDHQSVLELTIRAVKENELPSAAVRNVARPGVHGGHQGRWYGMASHASQMNLPAVAMMGTMGAYWATSSRIDRLDPSHFIRQLATFVQITKELMEVDLEVLRSRKD